jgi:DNA-binding NtrC family response regulator
MTDEAQAALVKYRWPGNVRQLSNVIERATILADDQTVSIDDLPRDVLGQASAYTARTTVPTARAPQADSDDDDNDTSLASIERAHVLDVLKSCQGNKARAARALGIHRRKLYRLLERFHNLDTTDVHASAAGVTPSEP